MVFDVIVYDVNCVVSDTVCQSARAEEVPLWVAKPEMFVGTEKLVAQIAFEKLQGFALRHARRGFDTHVYVFRHDA